MTKQTLVPKMNPLRFSAMSRLDFGVGRTRRSVVPALDRPAGAALRLVRLQIQPQLQFHEFPGSPVVPGLFDPGQQLLEEIDNWITLRDKPDPERGDRIVQTGLGIYHFVDGSEN